MEYTDYFGMSVAFSKLAQDAELYEKASYAARGEFDEKFTAEIMVKNLEKLYQEVTNERE